MQLSIKTISRGVTHDYYKMLSEYQRLLHFDKIKELREYLLEKEDFVSAHNIAKKSILDLS